MVQIHRQRQTRAATAVSVATIYNVDNYHIITNIISIEYAEIQRTSSYNQIE